MSVTNQPSLPLPEPQGGVPPQTEETGKLAGTNVKLNPKLKRQRAQNLPNLPKIHFNQSESTDAIPGIKNKVKRLKPDTEDKENLVSQKILVGETGVAIENITQACDSLKIIANDLTFYSHLIAQQATKSRNSNAQQFATTIMKMADQLKEISEKVQNEEISPKDSFKLLENINSKLRNYSSLQYGRLGPEFKDITVHGTNIPKCLQKCGQDIGKAQHFFK